MNDNKSLTIKNSEAEFLTFEKSNTENGIEVRYEDETLWMTQKSMAALFDVSNKTISEHLSNVFSSGELDKDSTVQIFRTVQTEGIDVDTGEARKLLKLMDLLLEKWYVARHDEEKLSEEITEISEEKESKRKENDLKNQTTN